MTVTWNYVSPNGSIRTDPGIPVALGRAKTLEETQRTQTGGKAMLITLLAALTGAYLTKTWWTKTWW